MAKWLRNRRCRMRTVSSSDLVHPRRAGAERQRRRHRPGQPPTEPMPFGRMVSTRIGSLNSAPVTIWPTCNGIASRTAAVSRRHRPDTAAWHRIATSLAHGPESPVKRLIETGRGDAQELLRDLTARDEKGLTRFPLLRGPKIRLMWIRMMVNPGRAAIDRIETIPVAVDVQVRRVTENLGVTATRGLRLRKAKPIIHQAWMEAVSETDIGGPPGIAGTCAALDPALWFFGKHGCGHCEKANRKVRFGRACDHCVRFS